MKIDSKYYVTVIVPVLNELAKRYCPDANHWFNNKNYDKYSKEGNLCFICQKELCDLDMNSIREHGINHLKEKNLLPFI